MSEFKKLLESSLLNEESKTVISEAFDLAVAAKTEENRVLFEAKLVEAKSEMLADAASMIEEAISEELEAISEEITHSRTLEVQYAEKLKMFKESYAEKQEESVRLMVAESVAKEVAELQEDIETAKKYEFVMGVFEEFKGTYERMFGSDDISVVDRLNEAVKELDILKREKKLGEILESVSGEKRDVVMTLLESVPTDRLEARFESLKGLILAPKEAPAKVVVESENAAAEVHGTVVLENVEPESHKETVANPVDERLARSLKFATFK